MNTSEKTKYKKRVSFSQFSNFLKCPNKFKLDHIEKLRTYKDSLHAILGTAIHEVFQSYLSTLYTDGAIKAEELDSFGMFKKVYNELSDKMKEKSEEGEFDEVLHTELYHDGVTILKEFLKPSNRSKYFPSGEYAVIGVELKIDLPIRNGVNFVAYLDLVLRNKTTGKYRIIDFKTSSAGWNKYMKLDDSKYSQLLLYKALFSKQMNVPLKDIDIEYFIVKRKLYENASFPQKHIQLFIPPHGKTFIDETLGEFISFLDFSFTKEGEYQKERNFWKNPGKQNKNCKFCEYYKKQCDAKVEK